MKYILIFIFIFGVLYSAPTNYSEYDLNPSGTMEAKNSMSGTFGNGYLGEYVDYGDILYQNADGYWYKFDGTDATMLVMSADAGKANKWHKFLISGYATKYNWAWTVGSNLYANTSSAGDMTHTEGITNAIVLGEATETNEMYFNPDYYEDEMILDYGDYFYLLHNGWTALDEDDNYRMFVDSNQDWNLQFYSTLLFSSAWFSPLMYDESENNLVFYGGVKAGVSDAKIFFSGTGIYPETTNKMELGTTSLAWEKLWAYDGDFTDDVQIDDDCNVDGNFTIQMSQADISSPPTDAELDAIWTSPAAAGAGFVAFIDDADGDARVYVITSNGSSWWYALLAKAL